MRVFIAAMFALYIGLPFLVAGFLFGFAKRGFILGVELAEDMFDAR